MAHTKFDDEHIGEILNEGLGTWYNARLLRALNDLLPYADAANGALLRHTYPEQCDALYRWWNDPSRARDKAGDLGVPQ